MRLAVLIKKECTTNVIIPVHFIHRVQNVPNIYLEHSTCKNNYNYNSTSHYRLLRADSHSVREHILTNIAEFELEIVMYTFFLYI